MLEDLTPRQTAATSDWHGSVKELWIAAETAGPLHTVQRVLAIAGQGLQGDRYAAGAGTWHNYPARERQVTLISIEALEEASEQIPGGLSPSETRRNVVTKGVPLDGLLGQKFLVGEALLRGMKICRPCTHLERLTGKGLIKALLDRGGINAEILRSGAIEQAAAITPS